MNLVGNGLKKYLKDEMLKKFIYNSDLWGETPNKYPMFAEVLNKKIQFFKNIFQYECI